MKDFGYILGIIAALFCEWLLFEAILILVAACFGFDFYFGPTIILWLVLSCYQYLHKKESKK